MDKNKLVLPISILLGCIILGGFYYVNQLNKQKSIERQQQIELSTKTGTGTDYFQKKIACEKYKDSILNKIKQYNNSQKPELRDTNNSGYGEPMYSLFVESNSLKEIFYSPEVNSCLYLEDDQTLVKAGANAKPDVGSWSIDYEDYYLIDVLTGEKINFNNGLPFLKIINRGEMSTSEKNANVIIDKYK